MVEYRGRFAAVLLALALLLVPGLGAQAESIIEEVEMRHLDMMSIRARYVLPAEAMERLTATALADICRRLPFEDCTYSVEEGARTVIFEATDIPDIELVDASKVGAEVALTFRHRYLPLQSRLGSVGGHEQRLIIRYPTHALDYEMVPTRAMENTFVITGPARPVEWFVREERVAVGEPIEIDMGMGEFCFVGLYSEEQMIGRAMALGCGSLMLPTDSALVGKDAEVRLVNYAQGTLRYSKLPPGTLGVLPPEFPIRLQVTPYDVPAGSPFLLQLFTEESLTGCHVSLNDIGGHVLMTNEFEQCDNILLGTSTAWRAGEQYIKVKAYAGALTGEAATNFVIKDEAGFRKGPELHLEQNVYTAGEQVRLWGDDLGGQAYCSARLETADGILVEETNSLGCEKVHITLDEELPQGNYVIRSELIERGRLTGRASFPLQVRSWNPMPGSPLALLCPAGAFRLREERLPCLRPGNTCTPTSIEVPLCLCFSSGGEISDVCHFGETCGRVKCEERAVSPYMIVYQEGQCLARRGTNALACARQGEMCTEACVCLSEGGNPIARCVGGEICTERGCEEPRLLFRVGSVEPDVVRENEVRDGIMVKVTGVLKYDGTVIRSTDVQITAYMAGEEHTGMIEDTVDGSRVIITLPVEGEVLPGEYQLTMQLIRGDDRVMVQKPFTVWYADDVLTVKQVQIQESVAREDLAAGDTFKMRVKLLDQGGREMVGVPVSAMDLDIDGVTINSLAAKYESGSYIVVGSLEADLPAGPRHVKFTVNHLGREGGITGTLNVLDEPPLTLSILDVEPGKKEKPILFILLSGLGFDLDVYLNVGGVDQVNKENTRVTINGQEITRLMSYAVNTNKGVRMHMTAVSLCPDVPPQGAKLLLEVILSRGGEQVSDRIVLHTRGNPGDWSNMGVAGCA